MKGFYQIADLQIEIEGNTTQLVRAQQAEREFQRACETLKEVSGADEVLIRSDHVEPKNGGPEFDQIRLRAYRPEESRHYTIDVGTTDNNPLGHYPRTDDGIKVWDWDEQTAAVIDPETGEINESDHESAANPSGHPSVSGSAERKRQEAQNPNTKDYHPARPPEPTEGTEHGQIDEETALMLWNAAKVAGGYDRDLFREMLSESFGVDNPKFLHVEDWERAWKYACDQEAWENEEEVFEPDDELPF